MADSRIIKYINDTLSQGFSEGDVKAALRKQGWSDLDIDEAMRAAKPQGAAKEPRPAKAMQEKGNKKQDQQAKPGHASGKTVMNGGFILTLAGGIAIILNALLVYLGIGDILGFLVQGAGIAPLGMMGIALAETDMFLINMIIGIFLAVSSAIAYAMPGRKRITGIFVIILSLVSVMAGNGFLVGGILALAGGILAVMDK